MTSTSSMPASLIRLCSSYVKYRLDSLVLPYVSHPWSEYPNMPVELWLSKSGWPNSCACKKQNTPSV